MKFFFNALIALCLGYSNYSSADIGFSGSNNDCQNDCCDICSPEWSLEFRIAGFFPTKKEISKHYSTVWPDYQLQIGKRFMCDWQAFVEFDWSEKKGNRYENSSNFHSKLEVFPISFGVKYFFNLFQDLDAYVGAGALYSFFRIKEDSNYYSHRTSKGNWGGVIKSGLVYTFCNTWYVDAFADYVFQEFRYTRPSEDPFTHRHNLNFNGFKLGGGIGYNF